MCFVMEDEMLLEVEAVSVDPIRKSSYLVNFKMILSDEIFKDPGGQLI